MHVLGGGHSDTIVSLNNKTFSYCCHHHHGFPLLLLLPAQVLMRRALESRMRVLGEGHSDTVVSLNNLASLLFQQGKTAEAVPLYKQ